MTILSHTFNRSFRPEHLLAPRTFDPLWSPQTWHHKSIVIEIGAGKGKHALQFAQRHPDIELIAIERTKEKFTAFAKQASQQSLPNLHLIHADAIAWITYAVPIAVLQHVYILYPNPEPRNKSQRWLNMPFFEWLLSRLKPEGRMTIASNIQSYIEEAQEIATSVWQLPCVRHQIPTDSQRTHFEIKYLARQESCWELTLTKPRGYQTRFDNHLPLITNRRLSDTQ